MSPIRKLLIVGVGVLALHGVQACASETELNPQPLPPQIGNEDRTQQEPDPAEKNGTSSGTGGSGGVPMASPDAGPEGDAGDAGDAGVD